MKNVMLMILLLAFFIVSGCSGYLGYMYDKDADSSDPLNLRREERRKKRANNERLMWAWALITRKPYDPDKNYCKDSSYTEMHVGDSSGTYYQTDVVCFHVSAAAPFTVKLITNSTNKGCLTAWVPDTKPVDSYGDDPSLLINTGYNDTWIRVSCYDGKGEGGPKDSCLPFSVNFF